MRYELSNMICKNVMELCGVRNFVEVVHRDLWITEFNQMCWTLLAKKSDVFSKPIFAERGNILKKSYFSRFGKNNHFKIHHHQSVTLEDEKESNAIGAANAASSLPSPGATRSSRGLPRSSSRPPPERIAQRLRRWERGDPRGWSGGDDVVQNLTRFTIFINFAIICPGVGQMLPNVYQMLTKCWQRAHQIVQYVWQSWLFPPYVIVKFDQKIKFD